MKKSPSYNFDQLTILLNVGEDEISKFWNDLVVNDRVVPLDNIYKIAIDKINEKIIGSELNVKVCFKSWQNGSMKKSVV